MIRVIWVTTFLLAVHVETVGAQSYENVAPSLSVEHDEDAEDMFSFSPRFNVVAPTLGGRQYWGDVLFFRGYRIQQHVMSKHFRLLDPYDFRLAWGTEEECLDVLEETKKRLGLPPMSGRGVIVVHGIFRSSKSFSTFRNRLSTLGATVVEFDYPSTQLPITESAAYLKRVIDSLDGIEQIDFVVHSLGGILVRTYLKEVGDQRDKRIHRMVMLGVPNTGARMANLLKETVAFKWAYGPAGQQLAEGDDGFIASLPVPDFEFAVIAGARGTEDGWNMFIPGDDDGTVSVESTRLPGASDFLAMKTLHSSMMWNREVVDASLRFLRTGVLRESGVREPILITDPS